MGNFNLALDSYFGAIEGTEQTILVMLLQSIGQIYYLHGNLEESFSSEDNKTVFRIFKPNTCINIERVLA